MKISKRKYIVPTVEQIGLDKAISLHLESVPPPGPDESFNTKNVPNDDPFKSGNQA